MNVEKVLKILANELTNQKIDFAVIGGLAVTVAGYPRSTLDIDLLTPLTHHPEIDNIMGNLGYNRLHKTNAVANYAHPLAALGQVDFVFAAHKHTQAMLERAVIRPILGCQIKVAQPEDIIGLKLLATASNPARYAHDTNDIQALIQLHKKKLNWNLLQEYFNFFNRQQDLEKLKANQTPAPLPSPEAVSSPEWHQTLTKISTQNKNN